MADHGAFNWNELFTGDVAQAKAFFAAVCGWTYDDMPNPGFTYTLAKSGDRMVCGMMDKTKIDMAEAPDHWRAYIAVDDVDAAVAQAAAGGGTILQGCVDYPNVGRFAIVRDPGGAAIGLMTPA